MSNETKTLEVVQAAPEQPQAVQRVPADEASNFALAQRQAQALSSSTLIPETYRGNVANCLIALNMAKRVGADPLAVMQHLYLVHGRPAWSSKWCISIVNSCGRFSNLRFEFTGEKGKDNWGCIAYATDLRTGEVLKGTEITIAMAKAEGWYNKSGSKWQTMPQQMLCYRSASFFASLFAPDLLNGIRPADEIEDIGDSKAATQVPALELKEAAKAATAKTERKATGETQGTLV